MTIYYGEWLGFEFQNFQLYKHKSRVLVKIIDFWRQKEFLKNRRK